MSLAQRTTDASRYFAAPSEHRLEARRFWCASPGDDLFVLLAWGRLEAEDAEELVATLEACARCGPRRRLQLIVLSDVTGVSSGAMTRVMRYYATGPRYLEGIQKEAVVRPEGVVAMLAEGFHRVVPLPFEGRVFTHEREALTWLRPALVERSPWLARLREQLHDHTRVTSPELERLAGLLATAGASLTLAQAARQTGQSPRTLQRRLSDAGTNFAREKSRALVAAAMQRLRESDRDIKDIAFELGFAAPQRFTELFARETGMPPAAWRAAQRL
ncbi:Transcriptional regulator, AraC family protein [Enhygromyxa salina]|uniref:Transcriptional regulator, AraC family protein n=1 Tax=Enhygromyxa salina TaxID=215803 RepID=A0A0C2DD39_9BACT|nr:AraC family transcriptional regulator [Enhygromyxa salina]KIG19335.1 Transcriptional regulator, AraC family protein [Enhygromyxa salina]